MVFQTVERDTESTLVACSQKLQEIRRITFCLYASEAPGLRYVVKLVWAYWNKAIDMLDARYETAGAIIMGRANNL